MYTKFHHSIPLSSRDWPFSLFQNLEFGNEKCHFAISCARSFQYQCLCKVIKIFHSVQEIGLFSLFQNLALGKASTNDKCHFAISWTRCHQYQCVCKILSKYSKQFRVINIFHEQVGDKIFTNCLVTKSNV